MEEIDESMPFVNDAIQTYVSKLSKHETAIRRRTVSFDNPDRTRLVSFTERRAHTLSENITIRRHLTLLNAIGVMVGSICGTGIFISPTGVTKEVGSVGLTLIIWTICGLLNLLLALCYAELGTAMPVAGGDYAYINHLLGPFPGFLCLWTIITIIGPCAATLTARTIGAYFTDMLSLDCQTSLMIATAVWTTVACALVNAVSVRWSAKLVTFAFLGKMAAMVVIIIVGFLQIVEGKTENFSNMMEGSKTDAGSIVMSILPGFVTFAGWEAVTALAEEMKNPKRDLPIATVVSMFLVILIYMLINIAYFTVLTPKEFAESNAVASNYAQKVLPGVTWLIPCFVIFSAAGSMIGAFLTYPRFTFAGGRESALPDVFSHLHIKYITPIPAIILMAVIAIFLDAAVFLDINALLNIEGIIEMIKILIAMIALLHLKFTQPHLKGTITVPTPFVIFASIILILIITVAIYSDPVTNGLAFLVVASGVPVYFFKEWAGQVTFINNIMDTITIYNQKLLQCIPDAISRS